ncbi:MAG: type II secretion system F family protein [Verrucomicrobiota bacterium]
MNWEEFAFVNQQLAGMLKSGIPLEGGLKQLCASMRRGALRTELERLEADLAKGVPLKDALAARELPAFYVSMVRAGVQSGDLPGVLIAVADYYTRAHSLGTRLKGILVYPTIVLVVCLLLTLFFSYGLGALAGALPGDAGIADEQWLMGVRAGLWLAPGLFGAGLLVGIVALAVPQYRQALRWRLPAFKEASLSNVASTVSLLLRGGNTLKDSLELVRQMERETPAGAELAVWQERLAAGHAKVGDLAAGAQVFPPLFVWLAASGGENLAEGFTRAADIYYRRAVYRSELFLYGALPIAILFLGALVISQTAAIFQGLVRFMDMLGG